MLETQTEKGMETANKHAAAVVIMAFFFDMHVSFCQHAAAAAAGERSLNPLLRAGGSAAERAAERVAQHGSEALAAHAGDAAVAASMRHAAAAGAHGSSRGLGALFDKLLDKVLTGRMFCRFSPTVGNLI